jgi:hypothetical protein
VYHQHLTPTIHKEERMGKLAAYVEINGKAEGSTRAGGWLPGETGHGH